MLWIVPSLLGGKSTFYNKKAKSFFAVSPKSSTRNQVSFLDKNCSSRLDFVIEIRIRNSLPGDDNSLLQTINVDYSVSSSTFVKRLPGFMLGLSTLRMTAIRFQLLCQLLCRFHRCKTKLYLGFCRYFCFWFRVRKRSINCIRLGYLAKLHYPILQNDETYYFNVLRCELFAGEVHHTQSPQCCTAYFKVGKYYLNALSKRNKRNFFWM